MDGEAMTIKFINAPDAAPAGGHYSHAVSANGFTFVSGILPVVAGAQGHTILPIANQMESVLANALAILTEAGYTREQVVKTTIYVVDIANWPEIDSLYAAFFGSHRPARAVVPVPALHHGYSVEMELMLVET